MTDAQLLEALREATRGLTYMSESDYPFEVFDWGGAEPTPEFLRGLDGSAADAPVETQTPDRFFRGSNSFQAVRRLLEANLSDLKVFRVGTINMPVYVAGRAASGSWLGVSTRAVET
jgi:hypothetical protein